MNTQLDLSRPGQAPDGLFQNKERLKVGSTVVRGASSRSVRMLRLGLL